MYSLEELVRPELLVMIPVLNFIASMMKKNGIENTCIPARLGVAGVFLAVCYELATVPITDFQSACNILFTGVTQGLLCAAGAVYLHQLKHQKEKSAAGDGTAPPAASAPEAASEAAPEAAAPPVQEDAEEAPRLRRRRRYE